VFIRTHDWLTREDHLADLGGTFREPVTVLATAQDKLYIIGLTPHGEVFVRPVSGQSTGEWNNLGGDFTGIVTGVTRGDSVDLLVSDIKGQIFRRNLQTDGSHSTEDWRRIGSGIRGAVAAIGTPRSELAVFGLADDGRILHRRLTFIGEWLPPAGDEWQVLGITNPGTSARGTIEVHWENDTDLIVSVFVDSELVGALLWAGYPEPDRAMDWVAVEAAGGERLTSN
jgi:hypothetical protein